MKIAISIPDPVFEAAEHLARRLGKSRSQLYAEAVAEYLQAHRADAVTERLDAVYTVERSTLDPEFQQAQIDTLPDEDW